MIIAIISWAVATFGIQVFHYYERYDELKSISERFANLLDRFAFLPQLIVFCILFGVSSVKFDLASATEGDVRTVAGNR